MNDLRAGDMIAVQRRVTAEKVRLDGLRLECLKLATSGDQLMKTKDAIEIAKELFDYVTEAPKLPQLYAVRRADDAEVGDYPSLGTLSYLTIIGESASWGYQHSAYRFRSHDEALTAIAKYEVRLAGVMQVVPFLPGTELF